MRGFLDGSHALFVRGDTWYSLDENPGQEFIHSTLLGGDFYFWGIRTDVG